MYLMKRGSCPISLDEVRAALGLTSRHVDGVILAGIASLTTMSVRPVVFEVWAIRDDDRFEERSTHYGTPSLIGEPRRLNDQDPALYRDCTYLPDDEAVITTRTRILNWCRNQHDIHAAIEADANPVPVSDLAAFWNAGPAGRALALQSAAANANARVRA